MRDRGGPVADPARRLFIVGDSLIVGSASRLHEHLDARWDVVVDAEVGRPTSTGLQVIRERSDDLGDTVVVWLGANDGAAWAAWAPKLAAVLDQLGPARRVLWVNLPETRSSFGHINSILHTEAANRSNLTIVDWRSVATSEPGLLAGDRLHLSRAGAERLASLVDQTLAGLPSTAVPPGAPSATQTDPSSGKGTDAAQVAAWEQAVRAADAAKAAEAADQLRAAQVAALAQAQAEIGGRIEAEHGEVARARTRVDAARQVGSAAGEVVAGPPPRSGGSIPKGDGSGAVNPALAGAGVGALGVGSIGVGAVLVRRRRRSRPPMVGS